MRKLYKFEVDFGRQGTLEGLFVEEEKLMEELYGETIYFGEVLGKHSDVELEMSKDMFLEIPIGPESLKELEKHLGNTWSGYNPINYWEDEEE